MARFDLHAFVQALGEREARIDSVYVRAFATGADDIDDRVVAAPAHSLDEPVNGVDVGVEIEILRLSGLSAFTRKLYLSGAICTIE